MTGIKLSILILTGICMPNLFTMLTNNQKKKKEKTGSGIQCDLHQFNWSTFRYSFRIMELKAFHFEAWATTKGKMVSFLRWSSDGVKYWTVLGWSF